jgi:hypothetical protein
MIRLGQTPICEFICDALLMGGSTVIYTGTLRPCEIMCTPGMQDVIRVALADARALVPHCRCEGPVENCRCQFPILHTVENRTLRMNMKIKWGQAFMVELLKLDDCIPNPDVFTKAVEELESLGGTMVHGGSVEDMVRANMSLYDLKK